MVLSLSVVKNHKKTSLFPATEQQTWKSNPHAGEEKLDVDQITTLDAIVKYVARTSGQAEFRVERCVADRFAVPNVKCLPTALFDDAVNFAMNHVSAPK